MSVTFQQNRTILNIFSMLRCYMKNTYYTYYMKELEFRDKKKKYFLQKRTQYTSATLY